MIRAYRPEDLPAIQAIGNRAWQPIYAMYRQRYGESLYAVLCADDANRKGEQIRDHCASHPDWVCIAEQAERIVGFATFFLDRQKKIGEIGNNAVDPDAGVKGVGQQLYQAVLARFVQEGMRFAKVQTGLDEAHAPARRAYERVGFDIHHENVVYYRNLTLKS